eukprot:220894_1
MTTRNPLLSTSKFVWCCQPCKSYRTERTTDQEQLQSCHICHQPTQLKIRCRHCKTINPASTIHTHCTKCNKTLRMPFSIDKVWDNEENWHYRIFLKGCNNFNSSFKNLSLLFYGFIINQFIDSNFYVPEEIIQYIMLYSFSVTRTDIEDKWKYSTYKVVKMNKCKTKLIVSNVFYLVNGLILYGECCFNYVHVRRVWKIRVNTKTIFYKWY